jgi:RNAse (barnase) inhibitor barstar
MTKSPLLAVTPPWILAADVESEAFKSALSELQSSGGEVILIDGVRAPSSASLFDEFAQAARLPGYFGRNWPALDECLADLEWLPATGYVVILRNPARLLESEPLSRATFVRVIERAAAEWSEAVTLGEDWDRPSKPFHLVADTGPNADNGGRLRALAKSDDCGWLAGRAPAKSSGDAE